MPETYEHEVTFETTSKYFIDAKSAGMYAKYIGDTTSERVVHTV